MGEALKALSAAGVSRRAVSIEVDPRTNSRPADAVRLSMLADCPGTGSLLR